MNVVDMRGLAVAGKLAQNAAPLKGGTAALPPADYLMEPKYDGWRIIAYVGDGHVDLFARSGNGYGGKLPKVEAELLDRFPPGTILDGEAVAISVTPEGGVLNEWGTAQSVLSSLGGHAAADKITFMVFDLLAHRGIDARSLALADRRCLLGDVFERDEFDAVQLSTIQEATDEGYEALVKMGFEGAMAKRLDRPYGSDKREGAGWHKMKASVTVDVVVTGFAAGKNGFTGMVGAIEFGQHDPDTGAMVQRGTCSGFDMRTRLDMTKNPEKWVGRVIEMKHMGVDIGKSGTGRFRHPQYQRCRPDKMAGQVVIHDA